MKIDINRRSQTFELFGYDFMIDENWKPWLIEVNTNPCMSLSGQYLGRLIPAMLDNVLRITIDAMFPPVETKRNVGREVGENKFELVFHELVQGD